MVEFEALQKIEIVSTDKKCHVPIIGATTEDEQYIAIGTQDGCVFIYRQPLTMKVIGIKLPGDLFPIQMSYSPCGDYLFVFTVANEK